MACFEAPSAEAALGSEANGGCAAGAGDWLIDLLEPDLPTSAMLKCLHG